MGALAWLAYMERVPRRKKEEKKVGGRTKDDFVLRAGHVRELVPLEFVRAGVYRAGNRYCLMAKIEGANFSVMSPDEQNAREVVLIDILRRFDFPVQFITTNVVADTLSVARSVALIAGEMPDCPLKTYAALYASALEAMRSEKQILAQYSYMVLTDEGEKGDPVAVLHERAAILAGILYQQAGVTLTPLASEGEVLDALAGILTPEIVARPSDALAAGSLEKLHINMREVLGNVF